MGGFKFEVPGLIVSSVSSVVPVVKEHCDDKVRLGSELGLGWCAWVTWVKCGQLRGHGGQHSAVSPGGVSAEAWTGKKCGECGVVKGRSWGAVPVEIRW